MGKITYFLVLVTITHVALLLFSNVGSTGFTEGAVTSADNSTSSLLNVFVNPSNLPSNSLWSEILVLFGQASLIVFAGTFLFRNDRFIFIAIAAIFATFLYPLYSLWSFLTGQGIGGGAAGFMMSLIMFPVIVGGIGVILDFAQGKD